MKNTILKQINDIGAKIGYPFYFYADGSFGKSIVSGKMNAIVVVKGKFTASDLKNECLDVWDDENLSFGEAVICLKEKMNFPIYIYSDGTCEKTPCLGGCSSVMVVKKSFIVREMTEKECQLVNPKIDHITPGVPRAKWVMPEPVVNSPTPLQLARLEVARQALLEGVDLTYEEEGALVFWGTDDEVRAYFPYLECDELLIWKGNQNLLEEYIEDNSVYMQLLEYYNKQGCQVKLFGKNIKNMPYAVASRDELIAAAGLDENGIANFIADKIKE